MKILGIDTSGKVASVALTDGDLLLWEKSVYTKLTHSQVILPMVKTALEETGLTFHDLDCLAVAKGPGSYTGLRIGIGAVKGICFGAPELKCMGVSTLQSLCYNTLDFQGYIAAVLKARPGVVYAGVYRSQSGTLTCVHEDRVCTEEELSQLLDPSAPTLITGDFAQPFKEKWAPDNDNIRLAAPANRLQRASSLCMAAQARPELMISADALEVSYLQKVKAEKLKDKKEEEQ